MLWSEQGAVSSGVGYNNNVLLSAFNPQGSGFFVNELDWVVTRVPLDGWQVVGSFLGDDIRYWRDAGTTSEDSFLGSLSVERALPAEWQAGLEARGLFEKQVLDISTAAGTPATALVKGYGLTAQPYLRKGLPAGFWVKLEMPVTRWYLEAPEDDYWDFGPVATVGCDLGRQADVSLSYGVSYQPHDQWEVPTIGGQLTPQLLEIFVQQAEATWHQYWDQQRHWRSSTRLTFAYRQDNGVGYFNYYLYQVSEDLRWQIHGWQIDGSVQFAYEDYPVQDNGEYNGVTLNREVLDLNLEVERRLYRQLKCFSKVEYQQSVSNYVEDADDYDGTTVSGGLRLDF